MPSQAHAILVELFRASPSLALDLLRTSGSPVPAWTSAIADSTFPVPAPDYHVDLAIEYVDDRGRPQLVVLVEVQLRRVARKLRSWPLYQAAARLRSRCDACVLVVALDERVARWAAAPVPLGPGGSVFRAIVLGPAEVPHHFDHLTPELSLLSALAHGRADSTTLDAAITAIAPLDDAQRSKAYLDLLRYHVGEAFDRALERLMATNEHKYLSDWARKYYDEGEAYGEARGEARGEAKGKATAILRILETRGVAVADGQRDRILACQDLARLDVWLGRALTATSAVEVVADFDAART